MGCIHNYCFVLQKYRDASVRVPRPHILVLEGWQSLGDKESSQGFGFVQNAQGRGCAEFCMQQIRYHHVAVVMLLTAQQWLPDSCDCVIITVSIRDTPSSNPISPLATNIKN
jgi:hypothetical protein